MSKYGSPRYIVPFDSLELAMKEVMNGNIYALFVDEIRANYLLKNIRSANIYTRKELIENQIDPFCMAVNTKQQNLLNWINLFIENLDNNGTKTIFFDRYLKGLK